MNKTQAIEISKAEFEVLEVLWQQSPLNAQEVIEKLNQQKSWHDKTVKTLLNRLVKKEAISFEKEQRKYLYYPLIAREEYTTKESSSFIERMFKGKVAPLVAGFASKNDLKKEDVEALKSIIAQWEDEND